MHNAHSSAIPQISVLQHRQSWTIPNASSPSPSLFLVKAAISSSAPSRRPIASTSPHHSSSPAGRKMVQKVYVTYNEVSLCRTTPLLHFAKRDPCPVLVPPPTTQRAPGTTKEDASPVHVSAGGEAG
jgi:hypothetical protein